MADINEKLGQLTRLILDDAKAERDNILSEVAAIRSQRLSNEEERLRQETYRYVQNELARVRAEAGRSISKRTLDNQRAIATRREEIADEVFEAVRARLTEYSKTPAYEQRLKTLFADAFSAIGNPYDGVVYLRSEDMRLKDELSSVMPGRFIEFREGSFVLGGLILDCPSKMQRVDESFDTALSELDGHFAELFGLSLS